MVRTLAVAAFLFAAASSAVAQDDPSLPPHLQGKKPPTPQDKPAPTPSRQDPVSNLDLSFQAERPTFTVSPYLVAPGVILVEAGMEFLKESENNFKADSFTLRVGGRYGLTETWEFFGDAELLKNASLTDGTNSTDEGFGFGDLRVGAKWSLLKQSGSLGAAGAMIDWKLPTGQASKGLGTGVGDLEVRALYGYLIENVRINFNFGLAFIGDTQETRTFKLQYINALEVQVQMDKFLILGELTYLTQANRGIQSSLFAGAAYYVMNDLRVDAGFRFGLSQDADDLMFTIGASFMGAKM